MTELLLICDDRMLAHHPTGWDPEHPEWTEAVMALLAEQYPDKSPDEWTHPERPERLAAIRDNLAGLALPGVHWALPRTAGKKALERVHTREYVAYVDSLEGRSCWLNQDTTAVSPGSVKAAKLAAGAGVRAVEAVARGEGKRAFCLVRPPGHHALHDRAMGFCLYNNVAVAARHAQHALDLRRILIFDWDLHHGNGTQEIFYDDPDVLFVDTHCQAPFYPGTGLLEETGASAATGTTVNVPLPAGSGNTALLEACDTVLAPAAEAFGPDLILVSAGFDAHRLDTIMAMDEYGFGALCRRVRALADRLCGGRLVLMLEGGYHADSLVASSEACARALAGDADFPVERDDGDAGLEAVREAARFHRAARGRRR